MMERDLSKMKSRENPYAGRLKKHQGIVALCHRYGVAQLDVFGSATSDMFNEETSDVDFLVVFSPCSPSEHYESYFGLLEGLDDLLGRPVDLVEAGAMRNPYFIRSVNETREPIYAA